MSKIKLGLIAFAACITSIVIIPLITTISVNSQNVSEITKGGVPVGNYGKAISGIVRPYNEKELLATPKQSATPSAIASPIANVPTFNQTVVRNPVDLELFDQNTPANGNIINVILNDEIVASNLSLTSTRQTFPLPLEAGINTIQIVVVNEGFAIPNTLCFQVGATQTVENVASGNCVALATGQQFVTTFGFPQIAFCLTEPITFPCTTRAYPESAQHILEAKGIPPQPIPQNVKPNKTGNPVPSEGYPLLFTIDRPRATSRRTASTDAYFPCLPGIQDLDEYPPSVLLENGGAAHIKCIDKSDNRGSGASLGNQINYPRTPGGIRQPRLDDGDIVEIQVLQ